MQKKIYVIGIGGIGISAIARYYNENGYKVYGSDKIDSELVQKLKKEGIDIIIGEDENRIDQSFDLVIYTESVPKTQIEIRKAISLNLRILTYPQALGEIANKKKLIAITGTHGKSTTTSLTSLILKDSEFDVNTVVGTILKEFSGKNCYFSDSEFFVIEACEYKRSFLNYKPTVGVITNIEIDHLDYYKDLEDYISAFRDFLGNIITGGFAILNGDDQNCKKLLGLRSDINYVEVYNDFFSFNGEKYNFPKINMKIPGNHILFDAKLSYTIGHMIGINDYEIIDTLEKYNGVWRRMENLGITKNGNILMSDYGHHPTEISLTLKALKQSNVDKKILTVFQPHQYNRTLELLEGFKNCFIDTDKLIIPNIYESRDTKEDKEKIDSKKLIGYINHVDKIDGDGLKNTLKLILDYDRQNPNSGIILLLGAGDVDDLRFKIDTSF